MGLTPSALSRQLKSGGQPAQGYLFLGSEPFYRSVCLRRIASSVLGSDPDRTARVEVDLKGQSLTEFFGEASAPSLFAPSRLVIGRNAEAALPRTAGKAAKQAKQLVADYFSDPVPGVTVVLEAVRLDWGERREKSRLQRIAKFFEAVPVSVELRALGTRAARNVATVLAGRMGLRIAAPAVAQLVDMLAADGLRIQGELEKLSLFAGTEREVTAKDLDQLVPEARQSGFFEFSDALALRDRGRALRLLDTMSKSGMYWPMQLKLTAGLFRQALAAKELGLSDARSISTRLASLGVRIWHGRARKVAGIASRFSTEELRAALIAVHEAFCALRSSRPEDRVVMEMLVMTLTRPRGARRG